MTAAPRTPAGTPVASGTPAHRRPFALLLAVAAGTAALTTACGGGGSPVAAASRTSAPAATVAPSVSGAASSAAPGTAAGTPAPVPSPTAAAPTATPARPATPVRIAPCPSGSLRATVGGPSDGAAGSTSFYVYFTNTGSTACTLSGHPGLSYVAGEDGHQVGKAADREGPSATVTLAPGGTAHARVRAGNPGNYDEAQCRPVPVTGYRVYPPDQTAALFVREAGTACSAPGVSLLVVGAVVAGRPAQPGAV